MEINRTHVLNHHRVGLAMDRAFPKPAGSVGKREGGGDVPTSISELVFRQFQAPGSPRGPPLAEEIYQRFHR